MWDTLIFILNVSLGVDNDDGEHDGDDDEED